MFLSRSEHRQILPLQNILLLTTPKHRKKPSGQLLGTRKRLPPKRQRHLLPLLLTTTPPKNPPANRRCHAAAVPAEAPLSASLGLLVTAMPPRLLLQRRRQLLKQWQQACRQRAAPLKRARLGLQWAVAVVVLRPGARRGGSEAARATPTTSAPLACLPGPRKV